MLTEIDARDTPSGEVSLWMDNDAGVYLVCMEGYTPVTCLTRDRALTAYRHPWLYMPLGGTESDSNGLGGSSLTPEPHVPDKLVEDVTRARTFGGLSDQTAAVFVELKALLEVMDEQDFTWTVALLAEILRNVARKRWPKPYDHEDGPNMEFLT